MAGGEETRRKLLAAVLLVGGGLTIPGGPLHLQARLQAAVGPGCEVMVGGREGGD